MWILEERTELMKVHQAHFPASAQAQVCIGREKSHYRNQVISGQLLRPKCVDTVLDRTHRVAKVGKEGGM